MPPAFLFFSLDIATSSSATVGGHLDVRNRDGETAKASNTFGSYVTGFDKSWLGRTHQADSFPITNR